MEIRRINNYSDSRFSEKVLKQHGAFEADVIEEFRYYAEHITKFYNESGQTVAELL